MINIVKCLLVGLAATKNKLKIELLAVRDLAQRILPLYQEVEHNIP